MIITRGIESPAQVLPEPWLSPLITHCLCLLGAAHRVVCSVYATNPKPKSNSTNIIARLRQYLRNQFRRLEWNKKIIIIILTTLARQLALMNHVDAAVHGRNEVKAGLVFAEI